MEAEAEVVKASTLPVRRSSGRNGHLVEKQRSSGRNGHLVEKQGSLGKDEVLKVKFDTIGKLRGVYQLFKRRGIKAHQQTMPDGVFLIVYPSEDKP